MTDYTEDEGREGVMGEAESALRVDVKALRERLQEAIPVLNRLVETSAKLDEYVRNQQLTCSIHQKTTSDMQANESMMHTRLVTLEMTTNNIKETVTSHAKLIWTVVIGGGAMIGKYLFDLIVRG